MESKRETELNWAEISNGPEDSSHAEEYPEESTGTGLIYGTNLNAHEFSEENEGAEKKTEIVRYRPAGVTSRVLSYLADILVIYALTNLFFGSIAASASGTSLWIVSISTVGIIGSLYFLLTTYFFRQTIGKMIFGIEVVGMDGKRPDFVSLIFREVVGRLVSQLGGLHLGYIWGAFHPRRQTWHDILGKTYVVHKKVEEQEKYIEIEQPA